MSARRRQNGLSLARLLWLCIGVPWGARSVEAATVHVPADASTLQLAIAAAATDDTVLVAAGTYSGSGNRDIDFGGKSIVVLSESGPAATIIDCGGSDSEPHRAFDFHSGELPGPARIEGFTVTHGVAVGDFTTGTGGAMRCRNFSGPYVRNCVFVGNRAQSSGGAVSADQSHIIVTACVLKGNSGGSGGALSLIGTLATVTDCAIHGNEGGGVFCNQSIVTFNGTTITSNHGSGGSGGVFSIRDSDVQFNRCIVWGNCYPFGPTGMDVYVQVSGSFHFYCSLIDPARAFFDGTSTAQYDLTLTLDPLFCAPAACAAAPTPDGEYTLGEASACLPGRSPCGALIGALGEGCAYVGAPPAPPVRAMLTLQAFPNPFRQSVHLTFAAQPQIAADGPAAGTDETTLLTIHDLAGRRVRVLQLAGASGAVLWDGRDASAQRVAAGVYIVRVESAARAASRSILLLR